jgi:hypothetical protein
LSSSKVDSHNVILSNPRHTPTMPPIVKMRFNALCLVLRHVLSFKTLGICRKKEASGSQISRHYHKPCRYGTRNTPRQYVLLPGPVTFDQKLYTLAEYA